MTVAAAPGMGTAAPPAGPPDAVEVQSSPGAGYSPGMTPARSPVPDFLRAFRESRPERLEPFLHEEVVFRADGFDPVRGRRAVLAYWRRMFAAHDAIVMSLERHVRDADLVVAAQRQLYLREGRDPLMFDSIAVYELLDERIRAWTDCPRGGPPDGQDAALWRRLRTDRW